MGSPSAGAGCGWESRRRWQGSTWCRRLVTVDVTWSEGVEPMTSKDEQIRGAITEQASEWFVSNDEAPLGSQDAAALAAWLRASPIHVEEFLGVATIARDLHLAAAHPEASLDSLLARGDAEAGVAVQSSWSRGRRWQLAAITAVVVAGVGLLLWGLRPVGRVSGPAQAAALHFETRHGQQETHRLADGSVLHLNTDSAVTVVYSGAQRLIALSSGEALFEVAHEPPRPFLVLAGPAKVVDLGTRFDVRLNPDSAVVTVVDGRVAVEPSGTPRKGDAGSRQSPPQRSVQLGANQQLSVADGQWPAVPVLVDARRTTSWLHRQITFDHEPLERVAAEFNRYAAKPVEITAPALRQLQVSGVFSTDDPEEFIAFLRSLEGVRVEVTATKIRVSQK